MRSTTVPIQDGGAVPQSYRSVPRATSRRVALLVALLAIVCLPTPATVASQAPAIGTRDGRELARLVAQDATIMRAFSNEQLVAYANYREAELRRELAGPLAALRDMGFATFEEFYWSPEFHGWMTESRARLRQQGLDLDALMQFVAGQIPEVAGEASPGLEALSPAASGALGRLEKVGKLKLAWEAIKSGVKDLFTWTYDWTDPQRQNFVTECISQTSNQSPGWDPGYLEFLCAGVQTSCEQEFSELADRDTNNPMELLDEQMAFQQCAISNLTAHTDEFLNAKERREQAKKYVDWKERCLEGFEWKPDPKPGKFPPGRCVKKKRAREAREKPKGEDTSGGVAGLVMDDCIHWTDTARTSVRLGSTASPCPDGQELFREVDPATGETIEICIPIVRGGITVTGDDEDLPPVSPGGAGRHDVCVSVIPLF